MLDRNLRDRHLVFGTLQLTDLIRDRRPKDPLLYLLLDSGWQIEQRQGPDHRALGDRKFSGQLSRRPPLRAWNEIIAPSSRRGT